MGFAGFLLPLVYPSRQATIPCDCLIYPYVFPDILENHPVLQGPLGSVTFLRAQEYPSESETGSNPTDRGDATSVSERRCPACVGVHARCRKRQFTMSVRWGAPNAVVPGNQRGRGGRVMSAQGGGTKSSRNTFLSRHTCVGPPRLQHCCGRAVPDCHLKMKVQGTHENGARMTHSGRQTFPLDEWPCARRWRTSKQFPK